MKNILALASKVILYNSQKRLTVIFIIGIITGLIFLNGKETSSEKNMADIQYLWLQRHFKTTVWTQIIKDNNENMQLIFKANETHFFW